MQKKCGQIFKDSVVYSLNKKWSNDYQERLDYDTTLHFGFFITY